MNLTLIQTQEDGTITRSLLSFETDREALSRLYSEMAYATAVDSPIKKIVAELVTDDGHVNKCERWERETDERD